MEQSIGILDLPIFQVLVKAKPFLNRIKMKEDFYLQLVRWLLAALIICSLVASVPHTGIYALSSL